MDIIKAMQVFIRVVEADGLSKAAETLGVPRSSVTMTLQRLERHLGVRLLQRTTRRISLTPDGEAYCNSARQILADIESTEAALRGREGSPRGRLRVDMPIAIGNSVILPALPAFSGRYPDIELAIGLGDRPVDLVQEGIDCVIRTGTLVDSSLIVRRVGSYRWMVCATPAYLAAHGTPERLSDLERHVAVDYFSSRNGRVEPWAFVDDGVVTEVTMTGRLAVNETSAYLTLGLAGYGLIRLADFIVTPHIVEGRLREVLSGMRAPPVPISILYPTARHLSPVVRAFVDWVTPLFGEASMADSPGP